MPGFAGFGIPVALQDFSVEVAADAMCPGEHAGIVVASSVMPHLHSFPLPWPSADADLMVPTAAGRADQRFGAEAVGYAGRFNGTKRLLVWHISDDLHTAASALRSVRGPSCASVPSPSCAARAPCAAGCVK